jgi:hypothetical protein
MLASTVVCPQTAVVSSEPLFPTPSTSSAVKTPENIEEGPNDPVASDEGESKWNAPVV